MKKGPKVFLIVAAVFACLMFLTATCTKMVDNSEIGIKFKKFALTNQGEVIANEVTGLIIYNPITTKVFTYPV